MSSTNQVYIADCCRTPIGRGRKGGKLNQLHPIELLALVLDAIAKRNNIPKSEVEDVICGCVTQVNDQGGNIGRLAVLKAGYPVTVPAVTLNRMCGSSQQSIHFGAHKVASGAASLVVACGVESMSRVPIGADAPGIWSKGLPFEFPFPLLHQARSAELLGRHYGITRSEADKLAVRSHKLATEATRAGRFQSQIVEVTLPSGETLKADEGMRPGTEMTHLAKLPSLFLTEGEKTNKASDIAAGRMGLVSAGNASQISDGASAVLLASEDACRRFGLRKRARVVATAEVGSDPILMLDGPIPATRKVLERAGLSIDQIDLFEINEAFATVMAAWMKTLSVPVDKVNVNGGAIAHGHPLGATGCVLMAKLVNELERRNARYGLQVMCIGHGQATATIVENCSWRPASKM